MANGDGNEQLAGVPSPTNPGGMGDPSQMPPQAGAAPQPTTGTQPQPQANAQQPAQDQKPAAAPAAPPKPGSFFHNVSHAFIGAVLGQAAEDGKRYGGAVSDSQTVIDPNTGERKVVPVGMTTNQKLGSLANRMLSGLANVPDSPIQAFGQSYAAQQKAKADKMAESKKTSEEDFKREQDLLMQKHDIAWKNAQTQTLALNLIKMRNDNNPQIPISRATMDAVRNSPDLAGWNVSEVSQSQLHDMMKDGHLVNSQILPLGRQEVTDPNGDPVQNPDGTIQSELRYGLITGPVGQQHAGKIVIPKAIADEFKDASAEVPELQNLKSFEEGSEMDINNFVKSMGAVTAWQNKVVNGWNAPKIGTAADGKTPIFINSFNGKTKPISYLTPEFKAEESKSELEKAQAVEARDKGQEALANAAAVSQGLGLGLQRYDMTDPVQKAKFGDTWDRVNNEIAKFPNEQRAAIAGLERDHDPQLLLAEFQVANGDLPSEKLLQQRKGQFGRLTPKQLFSDMAIISGGQWNDGLYKFKQEVLKKFADKNGDTIQSINNFAGHLGQMKKYADQYVQSNSPLYNMTVQQAQQYLAANPQFAGGQAGLAMSVIAPRDEWLSLIHNGHVPGIDETAETAKFTNPAATIGQLVGAGTAMAEQAITRMSNLDQEWQRAWGRGGHYAGLLSSEGYEGLKQYGYGAELAPYANSMSVGGVHSNVPGTANPQSGQAPAAPSPQSHVFDATKFKQDNPTADVNAAISAAKAAGYEVKQ